MEDDIPPQTDSLPPSVSPESNASHDNDVSSPSSEENEVEGTQTPPVAYTKEEGSVPEVVIHEAEHEEPAVVTEGPTEAVASSPLPSPEDAFANGHTATDAVSNAPPPTPPKGVDTPQTPQRKASVPTTRFSEATNASRPDVRAQSPSLSVASAGSVLAHRRSMTIARGHNVSMVLITSALETIASSKEAKRSAPLRDSTTKALELIRSNQGGDKPREIFEPLRLACETRNEKLMIASLDCISKLISYSFFNEGDSASAYASPPPSPSPAGRNAAGASQTNIPLPSLVDLVAHTITSCHTETTPDPVSLQIVKALLSLVLSPTILVHHSSLLKAVRTVYNIFLLSTDQVNQMVAQGGLTQMVHHVFTRCRRPAKSTAEPNGQHSASATRDSFTVYGSEADNSSTSNGHINHASSEETPASRTESVADSETIDGQSSEDKEGKAPLTLCGKSILKCPSR